MTRVLLLLVLAVLAGCTPIERRLDRIERRLDALEAEQTEILQWQRLAAAPRPR